MSATASATATSSSTGSASATAVATHTPSGSAHATATASATSSATGSATATTSATPSNSPNYVDQPAARSAVAGSFFGGLAAGGALLIGGLLCAPGILRPLSARVVQAAKRHAAQEGGGDEDEENRARATQPLLLAADGEDAGTVLLLLRSELAKQTGELDRYRSMMLSSNGGAATAAGAAGVAGKFWDRRDFLQSIANHVSLLSALLEDHLADSVHADDAGARALSVALRLLLLATEQRAGVILQDRRRALLDASVGGASAHSAPFADSMAFSVFFRGSMQLGWGDDGVIKWREDAAGVLAGWARSVAGGSEGLTRDVGQSIANAMTSVAARPAVLDWLCLHLRLACWPPTVDSNIAWSAVKSTTAQFDDSAHQLFSLSGRTPGACVLVHVVGPQLVTRRTGVAGGGEGVAADIPALRGRGCRTLVLSAA